MTANSSDEAPFFTFVSQDASNATADNILSTSAGNTSTSLDDPHAYPLLKNIFLQLEPALPASAACERLFSAVGIARVCVKPLE